MEDITNKKRKRRHDQQVPSKKKVVVVQDPRSLPETIEIASVMKPQFSPPILTTAPGITLSRDVQFDSYAKTQPLSSKKKKDVDNSVPTDLMLHSSSHATLDYTAREDKPPTGKSALQHYIGIFDPKTGKMEVVEARKMVLRGTVRAQRASAEAMGERKDRYNMLDLRTDLGQTFGTKKAKKALAAITENAISPTKAGTSPARLGVGDQALMQSIQQTTASMATTEQLQSAVDQAKPVPPGNFDAEDVQDVYDPKQIIGFDVLNAIPIRDWQDAARDNEVIKIGSRFAAMRMNRVATAAGQSVSEAEAVLRLRVLRYLSFLVIIWHGTGKGKAKGTRMMQRREQLLEALAPAPQLVIDSIVHKFSEKGQMRKVHMDLLMTHCCALACIIDSFNVNTLDLREDLKLEQKQVNQYFAEVGAKTRQVKADEGTETWARLSLPLQFPKVRMGRRK